MAEQKGPRLQKGKVEEFTLARVTGDPIIEPDSIFSENGLVPGHAKWTIDHDSLISFMGLGKIDFDALREGKRVIIRLAGLEVKYVKWQDMVYLDKEGHVVFEDWYDNRLRSTIYLK